MKAQLEAIVLQMRADRLPYTEAMRAFQRTFIWVVLRELKGNQSKAAQKLRMHRNTLARAIRGFHLDMKGIRSASRS